VEAQAVNAEKKQPDPFEEAAGPSWIRRAGAFVLTVGIMGLFWVLFSGRFDAFHLSMGLFSCLLVAALSGDLMFPQGIVPGFFGRALRFAGYIPWLLIEIYKASFHVLYLVLHPKMMDLIDPYILEFDSHLTSEMSRTTFANSITLTPGTITVNVTVLGTFTVHCIDRPSGESLPGEMQRKIGKVFKE
jgi:multicomponent Na+:H+ antiporter subunit E